MMVISNTESFIVYGVEITYYKDEDVYRAFLGGNKYEEKDLSTLEYIIWQLQSGVGVVH